MAHNITLVNGKYSFAYAGEAGWHRLGQQVPEDSPLEVWLEEAGLNWTALESQMFFPVTDGQMAPVPGHKVLYRSDIHTTLAVVSNRFKPVQPKSMLAFFESAIADFGFKMSTAGALKGGRKVFASARVGKGFKVHGVDEMRPYLMFSTAFDGSLPTNIRFCYIRPVCDNTVTAALRGKSTGEVTVRHVSRFKSEEVQSQMGLLLSTQKDMEEAFNALASVKIGEEQARDFVAKLLVAPDAVDLQAPVVKSAEIIYGLFAGQGRGATLASANGTAFGLLNAITEYVDHHKPSRNEDNRTDSAMFGLGNAMKNRALDRLLALAA